jgi:hypothetical protein
MVPMNTIELPDHFRLARYRFDLEAIDALHLPAYKGGTFRGGFGYAFKKMVCIQADWRACTPCKLGNKCPYGYIFETSVPEDSQVLRSLHEVPTPFVIEPALDEQTAYAPGDRLAFELVLVGRGINYLPYFIVAFQELGRSGIGKPPGRYSLQRIQSVHPWRHTRELVYDGVDVRVGDRDLSASSADVAGRAATLPTDWLRLRFLTPTRLKHQGQYVRQPEFHVLIRALLRRVSSLSYFHCGQLWETDYRGIIAAAEEVQATRQAVDWVDWERFSGRQKQRMNLGGFVGEVTYRGELGSFRPLLVLGELGHVGKACVFGNGWYELEG